MGATKVPRVLLDVEKLRFGDLSLQVSCSIFLHVLITIDYQMLCIYIYNVVELYMII